MSRRLIHVERWDDFQHYGKREAPWIKNYTRLLDDHKYLSLTHAQRSVLHGLWLAYAKTHREVPDDTAWLSRYLAVKVTRPTLDALNHAGFIRFSASSALAPRYHDASPEGEREKETERKGLEGFGIGGELVDITEAPRKKQNADKRLRAGDGTAKYTGARWVTGANGSGGKFIPDALGIDYPPADWPYPQPSNAEIVAALEKERAA